MAVIGHLTSGENKWHQNRGERERKFFAMAARRRRRLAISWLTRKDIQERNSNYKDGERTMDQFT